MTRCCSARSEPISVRSDELCDSDVNCAICALPASSSRPSSRCAWARMATVSVPSGKGAPVVMRTHSPGPTRSPWAKPAYCCPTSRRRVGPSEARLACANATPSIRLLSNDGRSIGARTASASTRPTMSARAVCMSPSEASTLLAGAVVLPGTGPRSPDATRRAAQQAEVAARKAEQLATVAVEKASAEGKELARSAESAEPRAAGAPRGGGAPGPRAPAPQQSKSSEGGRKWAGGTGPS